MDLLHLVDRLEELVGSALGALLPSLKMAVAYPLANKMRTGMTMAMFCLVVFALTVMSSMNYNFERLFLSDRALGGWDILVEEHPTNPLGDLRGALSAAGSPALSQVDSVGVASVRLSESLPPWPRNSRVGENSPSLWPTMFSVM